MLKHWCHRLGGSSSKPIKHIAQRAPHLFILWRLGIRPKAGE